ncbi:SH3 domain and tetratricopeptide repeat-containing protein 2 isoform X2 [Anguilla rostrata]|uniref:SH3 domain and tetratricopeptide repeat-containing protein 2 isoform X2 n=1 Tax=Anguilla rostrata TaxID=7938 RepID=UPI0030D40B7A
MGNVLSNEDVSPAELDALWREPPYTSAGANELFPGNDIMTTDKGEDDQVSDQSLAVEPKPGNYWKEKSAFSRGSTVSLAVGERFSSDVLLVFRGRRRCSGEPDSDLQEALRTRLRVVESNSQDVIQLFKDLSARLLSVHAEKDCFIITFKTVEEIWKFSTYLSLGYVARCLENFLCDQTFWLDSARLSDVEICVTVDEEHLATLYLGLLLQEGSFFAKALYNSRHTEEEDLVFRKDDLVMVRDTGQETVWEGTLLKSGQHGLVPVLSMQPLPYPFYQWFFRKYPGTACGPRVTKAQFEHPVVTGTCVAVVDHNPLGLDELQFSRGDLIEVVGFLLASLEVFIGRHFSSGQMGFVQKAHMRPENVRPLDGRLVFLSEEERAALSQLNPCNEQYHSGLLSKLSTTDISTVYRLDRLDESDFPYIKNQPKQEPKPPVSARQSVFMEKSDSPPFPSSPRLSVYASQSLLDQDGEPLSFSLEDTFKEMDEFEEDPALFLEEGAWEGEEGEACDPTLALLNEDGFRESYRELYDLSYSFLGSAFGGVPEEELLQHLEGVREAAKNRRMPWALRRSCFLLGRLCARKSKYSQARVYLEEALRVPLPGFRDLPLLIALYTGLTAIYLQQRLEDKLALTLERACALLLGLPGHRFGSALELELLRLALRRAVVESDRHLEARSCYLALRLFLELGKVEDALPFVERLQFLSISLAEEEARPLAPVDLNWMLSRLYHRKYLPHMALASLSLDSAPDRSLPDAFQKIEVFIKNSVRLNPQWREGTSLIPAQIVVYLQQALSIASRHGDLRTQRDLCMSLACIYQQHGALEMAVQCAQRAGGHISGTGGHISDTGGHMSDTRGHMSETGGHISDTGDHISDTGGHISDTGGHISDTGGHISDTGGHISEEEGFEASVLLAWLLVQTGKEERAAATLKPLLQSLNETDSPAQRGVVYNLLALCLRKEGRVPEAARHFYSALQISRENGNKRNEALALANLGCLALSVCAPALAERFLLRALPLFQELADRPTDAEHAQALLWLGRSYRDRGRTQDVRLSYETALLIAIGAKNLHSQMVVAKALSHLYCDLLLHGQCIIYYEHCVALSRELKDKRLEGEYLEILSNLYLSLNTEKSSRKSLDYTKQSLRISIDLGKREEESETWLQVGRIYYLIREDELADMYLQAAVKTALRVNDPYFATSIYEEAGDVFFQGHRNRLSALPFYRDGSLPFARSVKDVQSEFRLLSKLTELLTSQEQYEAALQYAVLAVQVSTTTGDRLKERTAFHRLATVYYSLQQFELAENYYLKSLSLSPALLELPSEAQYYVKVYCRLGDLTLHKLKDAFDAVGYLHLALAAALVDQENPRALCRVYRKLAEIHATHMPDAELSRSYADSARALRDNSSGDAGESAPPPGTQADGPPPGTQADGPPPGTQTDGPPPGTQTDGPPPGTQMDGPPPGTQTDGPPPGTQTDGPPPGTQPDGPPPGTQTDGPPPGTQPDGPPLAVRPTCAVEEQGDGTGAQNSDLPQPEPKSALSASEDTLQESNI